MLILPTLLAFANGFIDLAGEFLATDHAFVHLTLLDENRHISPRPCFLTHSSMKYRQVEEPGLVWEFPHIQLCVTASDWRAV
jgi:hypothetical protein